MPLSALVRQLQQAPLTGEVLARIDRPERLRLKPYGSGVLHARVEQIVFAGPVTRVRVRVGDLELETVVPNDGASLPGKEGEMVDISLGRDAVRLLID